MLDVFGNRYRFRRCLQRCLCLFLANVLFGCQMVPIGKLLSTTSLAQMGADQDVPRQWEPKIEANEELEAQNDD